MDSERKEYQYKLQIRERHLDTFGHVNNATYLEIFEEARWEMIEKAGWGLEEIKKKKVGPVILEINIKYQKEVLNREFVTVLTRLLERKNKKITLIKQEIINEKGELTTTIELTLGFMDLEKRMLIIPPQSWNNIFSEIDT